MKSYTETVLSGQGVLREECAVSIFDHCYYVYVGVCVYRLMR